MTLRSLACAFGLFACSAAFAQRPQAQFHPCGFKQVEGESQCGSISVFEDRMHRRGRKIAIEFVVLKALRQSSKPNPPLVDFPGGPGIASVADAEPISQIFGFVREERDLVLVDQRGTGKSGLLYCDLHASHGSPQQKLAGFMPPDRVKACRAELEKKADLRCYTTSVAVQDFDDLRQALGYDKWIVHGLSYGGRMALTYAREYPTHTAALLLESPASVHGNIVLDIARAAQQSLDLLFRDCRQDAACHNTYPTLEDDFTSLRKQFAESKATVAVREKPEAPPVNVSLDYGLFAETVRNHLYTPEDAATLPYLIHQAAAGDLAPLVETALGSYGREDDFSWGVFLSVECAEDVARIRKSDVAATRGTFMGDYRVRQQQAGCREWPRGFTSKRDGKPVKTDVPILVVNGEEDCITPPSLGKQIADGSASGRQIVIPTGGHGFDGLEHIECLDRLEHAFLNSGSTNDLPTACVATMHRPPFKLK
jgi:pimeloyl-ACP methyl ester carboxylesterase